MPKPESRGTMTAVGSGIESGDIPKSIENLEQGGYHGNSLLYEMQEEGGDKEPKAGYAQER